MASEGMIISDRARIIINELQNGGDISDQEVVRKLSEFRVLTRSKTIDNSLLNVQAIDVLVGYASRGYVEAQKSLSNLILNYEHLRMNLVQPYVDCAADRFRKVTRVSPDTKECNHDNEVIYYDLRIIFLLSALCPLSRVSINDRISEMLWMIASNQAIISDNLNFQTLTESLRTLFNLTIDGCMNEKLAGDVMNRLFIKVREYESSTDVNVEKNRKELQASLIHLLTNMPHGVYKRLSEEDYDMVLNYLERELEKVKPQSVRETILPVLNACSNICSISQTTRLRWFERILGSTTDFSKRPEEYDNLKGRLVKMMTSVDVHVKDIAASFLHSLCAGDTEKLITYTGFGNSAAFLSSRGLLSQAMTRLDQSESNGKDLSDYDRVRDRIDPITGKLETPRQNPLHGLTEEEKEYHANELADAIARLSNLGVIRPMKIDKDGQVSELNP